MTTLKSWMALFFSRFPHIPENLRKNLTSIIPWLALIFGIFELFFLFVVFIQFPLIIWGIYGSDILPIPLSTSLIASAVICMLSFLAFKPLRAYSKKGWDLLFYSVVIFTSDAIINSVFGIVSVRNLVGAFIGVWLLFEIRGLYR